jgi:hypothetical protein
MPTLFMAPSSCAYCTFTSTFEALEVPYFHRETVLQFPGHRYTKDEPALFLKSLSWRRTQHTYLPTDVSVNEGVNTDNKTEIMLNLPLPPQDEEPSEAIQQGPVTFDPLLPLEEGEDIQLTAAGNQAELMRWHYHLGHLSFSKLKQLALNGEIPMKLAKISPPRCAGCLFGMMTKLPWQGKEAKSPHKDFIATKPLIHRTSQVALV